MAGLNGKIGLWCQETDRLLNHLHQIQDLGFDYVVARAVQRSHGTSIPFQPANLAQLIQDAATIDLPVYCWAYCFPNDVEGQIAGIADALPNPCMNLILDIEEEWEPIEDKDDRAHALFHGIAQATGHRATLHMSTYCNPQDHPVPAAACLAHCESLMPQVYRIPPTSAARVMKRTMLECPDLARNSLGGLLIPTVNRPEMLSAVLDEQQDSGSFAGVNVWLWDTMGDDPGVSDNIDDWRDPLKRFHRVYR